MTRTTTTVEARLISTAEAARRLGVAKRTVGRMGRRNQLHAIAISTHHTRWRAAEVDALASAGGWVSAKEVCAMLRKRLGVERCTRTVYRLVDAGRIDAVRLGGKRMISRRAAEEYVREVAKAKRPASPS